MEIERKKKHVYTVQVNNNKEERSFFKNFCKELIAGDSYRVHSFNNQT